MASVKPLRWPATYIQATRNDHNLGAYHRAVEKRRDSKWLELRNIIREAEAHVMRRLTNGKWSRGKSDDSALIDSSWNHNEYISRYNQFNGAEQDSLEGTPEDFVVAIKKLEKLQSNIDVERKRALNSNSQTCRNLPTTFIRRQKIYSDAGKRSPYQASQGTSGEQLFLTPNEAGYLQQSIKKDLRRLRDQSQRKWGLCRDWAASVSRHLPNAIELRHYQVGAKQFDKSFGSMVLQHTVCLITDNENDICSKSFTIVLDAWKSPTVFAEFETWKRATSYA